RPVVGRRARPARVREPVASVDLRSQLARRGRRGVGRPLPPPPERAARREGAEGPRGRTESEAPVALSPASRPEGPRRRARPLEGRRGAGGVAGASPPGPRGTGAWRLINQRAPIVTILRTGG